VSRRSDPRSIDGLLTFRHLNQREKGVQVKELSDVLYEVEDGLARITINRPERLNAFRARTVDELIDCFKRAWASEDVGVISLTGAGDRAFCTGGDQKQRAETGDYGPSESGLFEVEYLHRLIREIPKPVIAAVNGYAIGGGHVLHLLCDLTIAAGSAVFGQTGPRVGSFDAGFGTGYLARVVGEKRAREIWFLCRRYDAQTAERWGLVNRVVPASELRAETRHWADEMLRLSPTALRFIKQSFNADTEHLAGIGQLAFSGLRLFVESDEAQEGVRAFSEKRDPDFSQFRGRVSA
jgi:2-ketocyclohexanecarboxyl-CoA hydrolase